LLLVLGLAGCSSRPVDPNRPKTVPVSGTVTYKGAPVEGATVTFFAQGGGKRGAVGRTDASGQFTLTTFDPKDGAIPGSYLVAIEKSVLEGAPPEGATGKAGEEPPAGTVKDLIPSKYKDPNKSGLTADVKEGGVKDLKFDLTD
jgi:hypothetical protein